MHIQKLLHNLFDNTSSKIDKRNHKTLIEAVVTLSECKHLSIAALGRNLNSPAHIKHNIKRIDRLFGNRQVQSKTFLYYQQMTHGLLNNIKRPTISIDWSGLTPCGEFHFIRASCPVGGRAITLFERSYTEQEYMKQKTHRAFLEMLKTILPKDCRPIIVTDAGFRNPWFQLVDSFGWDFVGRVRNKTQFFCPTSQSWSPIKSLYTDATLKPKYLFKALLAKVNPLKGYFHLVKSKPKQRKRKNLRGQKIQCSVSLKHAKRGREPWLIFTSLPAHQYSTEKIIKFYAQRMQIEESFRDLKNTNNGLSLRHCRSYQKGRLNVALLIAAIATFLLWLIGLVAKQKQVHFSYQANSIKTRNVLSTFSIGWQYLKRQGKQIRLKDCRLALKKMHEDFCQCM